MKLFYQVKSQTLCHEICHDFLFQKILIITAENKPLSQGMLLKILLLGSRLKLSNTKSGSKVAIDYRLDDEKKKS
jgi:hypothetical protein